MKSALRLLALLLPALPAGAQPPALAVRAARILPVSSGPIEDGLLLVRDGDVEALGPAARLSRPADAELIHLPGAWIVPGFVDLHTHVAGTDYNEPTHPVNADLHVLDQLVPGNEMLLDALAGGVTTTLYIPGSATNLGGFGALLKPAGRDLDEAILRFPGAMKIAQALNPERSSGEIGRGRMGMNWNLRRELRQGLDYHRAWLEHEEGRRAEPPPRVHRLEMMRGLFRGDFPALVHTAFMPVFQSTIRMLHDEFGVGVVLSHGTFDSFHNAPLVVERDLPVDLGPRLFHVDYDTGRVVGLAARYHDQGVERLSINTDAPNVPMEELSLQAALSVRMGLPWDTALRAITLTPAEAVGVADRVGSLEPGKDADFAAWTGDPLDPRSRVLLVVSDGRIALDARDPSVERRF
jgi:imidazolonepropionase-like amidohydrolase